MEIPVVTMLNIGENLIPCRWILRVVHAHDVHNNMIDDLFWSSVWGWKIVDLVSLVSNSDQSLDQNVLRTFS
jgi:hypothetical protein